MPSERQKPGSYDENTVTYATFHSTVKRYHRLLGNILVFSGNSTEEWSSAPTSFGTRRPIICSESMRITLATFAISTGRRHKRRLLRLLPNVASQLLTEQFKRVLHYTLAEGESVWSTSPIMG